MNTKKRNRIIEKTERLLQENNIDSPPVPVRRIAKSLDARVIFSPLDSELSGMIYVKGRTPIIGINSLHHPNRQRFTIAHECGHLALHKGLIGKKIHVDKRFPMLMRDSLSAAGISRIEIEANLFAAEILMPRHLLTEVLNNEPFDIDEEETVNSLARSFRVSPAAMRFRLGNLFA